MPKIRLGFLITIIAGLVLCQKNALAEYYFEVLNVGGNATTKTADNAEKQALTQGKILTANTWVEVAEDGFVDLALDREWQNTIRVGEKTKVFLTAIFPTGFYMEYGDLFAKLDALPKDSTLEIQTPVAVAAVRGTVFRVLHKGQTKVENYSASKIYVFGITSFRSMYGDPIELGDNQTTDIAQTGTEPALPRSMTEKELKLGLEQKSGLDQSIKASHAAGRIGAIQSVDEVSKQYTKDLDERVKAHMAALVDQKQKEDLSINPNPNDLERIEQTTVWDQKERKDEVSGSGSGDGGFFDKKPGGGSKPGIISVEDKGVGSKDGSGGGNTPEFEILSP